MSQVFLKGGGSNMNKENEAKKIILIYEKITQHIILEFEERMKMNRELLEKDLENKKDFLTRLDSVSSTKRDNWKAQYSAEDQLERGKQQAKLMLEAFCIEDKTKEILLESMYTEAFVKINDKENEEDAELDKKRNSIEKRDHEEDHK